MMVNDDTAINEVQNHFIVFAKRRDPERPKASGDKFFYYTWVWGVGGRARWAPHYLNVRVCVCVPGLIKNERDAHYLDESRQRNKRTRRPHRTTNDFWAGDFSLQHPKIPPLKVRFMWMRMRVVLGFNYLWFHPSRRRSARCLSNCLPLVKMFSFCTGLEPRPDAHTSACGIWWWRKRYQICNLSERKFNENNSFSYLMISVS